MQKYMLVKEQMLIGDFESFLTISIEGIRVLLYINSCIVTTNSGEIISWQMRNFALYYYFKVYHILLEESEFDYAFILINVV